MLIDELLTPDSSRFWDAARYAPGGPQPSFDKQYVRDWLTASGWDRESPAPVLPARGYRPHGGALSGSLYATDRRDTDHPPPDRPSPQILEW